MTSMIPIPSTIITLAHAIHALPKKYTTTPRLLLVGGAVRDMLMRAVISDIDTEAYGVSYTQLVALLHTLPKQGLSTQAKKFGVVSLSLEGQKIDIALPRTEIKTSKGYFGFTVTVNPNLSIRHAAQRRDFTVNAIYYDPLTKEFIDPYGGKRDLENKTLRMVNKKKFSEDPLRVYRALQFVSRFNFAIEANTLEVLEKMAQSRDFTHIPKARITNELRKMKTGIFKKRGFVLAKHLGIQVSES